MTRGVKGAVGINFDITITGPLGDFLLSWCYKKGRIAKKYPEGVVIDIPYSHFC
jgi:hypothetical protein